MRTSNLPWLRVVTAGNVTESAAHDVYQRQFADVTLTTKLPVSNVREMTEPRPLTVKNGEISLRVPAGDVQVVSITVK